MKLLCFASLAILLAVRGARANAGEEVHRNRNVGEWPTNLVVGQWPYEGSLPKKGDDSYVDTDMYDDFVKKFELIDMPDSLALKQNLPGVETDLFSSKMKYAINDGVGESVHDSSLDTIVDFLLGLVSKEIVAKGKDQIPVPDMSEEFEKRVAFVTLHGKFEAHGGWFKNVSTIQRTGDVIVTRRGSDTLVVACEMGLATMQFGFELYRANLAGIAVEGHMTGSVGSNSVSLQVAVSVDGGKCNATLERLQMDRFDGLDVDLTGLGSLSWLLNSIAGWATRHFKDNIVSSIENNLRTAVTELLAKYHCDEHINLLQGLTEGEVGQDISVVQV